MAFDPLSGRTPRCRRASRIKGAARRSIRALGRGRWRNGPGVEGNGGRSPFLARVRELPAERDRRDPARRARGPVRHPGLRRQTAAAELRRSGVPRRLGLPLSARGLSGAVRDQRHHRRPLRRAADRARDPDHHRRHELRRARVPRQGGARPRRHRDGHEHDHGRWRHDRRGARRVQDPGLPGAAVALRPQSGRPAPRRCDRGRGRPGRQARRRRHAARAQDHRAGRRHAHAAPGHRPAQRLPPSRLDRPRRPHDQDRRAARDHRLAKADLRQDRRDAHQLRRGALRQGRRRCDRARRHAGRHRRHPGRVHRARRHSDPAGGAPGGRGAAGARHAPQGAADRVRRHPERRGRRQGHGARRRCRLDRHRGADRAELQRAALRGGLRRPRHQARLLPPLPHRTLPGRHHHPGSRAGAAPRRRAGGAPGAQLSLDHGAGGADARARLRQVASA